MAACQDATIDPESWLAFDAFFCEHLLKRDATLAAALEYSAAAGLPPISVSSAPGRFLHLRARIQGARPLLEIGTLGGYSAMWLGRALPSDAMLVSVEHNPDRADLARRTLDRAALSARVNVRLGAATDSLHAMHATPRARCLSTW